MRDRAEQTMDAETFGEPPARDERFCVKDRWSECVNFPKGHALKEVEFFHRQLNEEMNGMENAADSADWRLQNRLGYA